MQVVLLRVGIDLGSGGLLGPLYSDRSFEHIPIPDDKYRANSSTYSNTCGTHKRPLIDYFYVRQKAMKEMPIHNDPEWETFTYGDPTSNKARLRTLQRGDLLAFYCGLKGWDFESAPALYLIGYFEVQVAGWANDFDPEQLNTLFKHNFHVRHNNIFEEQRDRLVLVKGSERSRLLSKAVQISERGKDKRGWPLHILAPHMQERFGSFNGKVSIQRCPPRWVESSFVNKAADFLFSLE
jgi:hypothetical protein